MAPGEKKRFEINGLAVCVINLDGEYYAVADTCTHAKASLSNGQLMGNEIQCPMHGAYFDVKTGAVMSPPAVEPIATYAVTIEGKELYLEADTV
jgi:nitrite reductase/ring-hydroxylating ferredoxin subunit